MIAETSTINRIKIENADVFLEDFGPNQGKITISDTYGHNFSYYWGSMGGDLNSFLCSINKEYFASKLMGPRSDNIVDVKRTFSAIRKYIRDEMYLPWYAHQEFQKDMRDRLNQFQQECADYPNNNFFVAFFHTNFINRLNFYLIDDSIEQKNIKRNFESLDECWHFIVNEPHPDYKWLLKFHDKLKKAITTNNKSKQ